MTRGFCKQRDWRWRQRGHPVYRLEKVRWPLERTVSYQAGKRTVEAVRVACGGAYDGKTGDGEAWREQGYFGHAFFIRLIRGGRWAGYWQKKGEIDD